MENQPLVLVVDDDRLVHRILERLLKAADYSVLDAYNAADGIELAVEKKPDLILLDIMMPKMTGFEAVGVLKSNPATSPIPVIFLSARGDSQVEGLELGASDFVNKPFDKAELLARIKTHIKLKKQEEILTEYSQNLERMVQERTRQLVHAERLASLGTLSAGIAHEINNPTTFITGNLQTLEIFWGDIVKFIKAHLDPEEGDRKIEYILQEVPDMLLSIKSGADRITSIVSGLNMYSRKDSLDKEPTDLSKCIEEAGKLTHNKLKYHVCIETDLEPNLPLVSANSQQMVQVFVNLLVNAADAIDTKSGTLLITAGLNSDGWVEIRFKDNGGGVLPKVEQKIFDPFFTTKPVGRGTGLGLSIIQGIIIDHNGTIELENDYPHGATFFVRIPVEQRT